MRALVTGGKGFIGSHLVDALVERGDQVFVADIGLCGDNVNPGAQYFDIDVRLDMEHFVGGVWPDVIFHCAAIARTPWCVDDPRLCYETNVMGTLNVLEAARLNKVGRVILSSSNVAQGAPTPYWSSKRALEDLVQVYSTLYGVSCLGLRYSNAYGTRQREDGPSPNVFAAFRKSKREKGYIELTGDGEQTRDFTHVSDLVRGNIIAARSTWRGGTLDLCTGRNVSMNYVAKELFGAEVRYIEERRGDIKHIVQDPDPAWLHLGWTPWRRLEDGIKDVL